MMSAPPHEARHGPQHPDDADRHDVRSFQQALARQDAAAAQAALAHLKGRWWSSTVSAVQAIVVDQQRVNAVTEQAWQRVREELAAFDGTRPLEAFLMTIVRRQAEAWQDQADIGRFRDALASANHTTAEAAFERLYQRWWTRTVRVADRIIGDDDLAEDAAQQAWLRVYSALKPGGSYDNTRPFRPFLTTVVINKARDVLQQGARPVPPAPVPPPPPSNDWLRRRLHACLAELRYTLRQRLTHTGLSAVFEQLDTIPPVANAALREFVLALVDNGLRYVQTREDGPLTELQRQVASGTPNPVSEQQAAAALLRRTRMPAHDPGCPLFDWFERFLEALLPGPANRELRYDWWAYLAATQTLAFGAATAACALYRIRPNTFNAGANSRWHIRMQPLADCVTT